MTWRGPTWVCSLCKQSVPYVLVPPKATGAKAVRVAICPRCDKETSEDRKKHGGR